MSEMNLGILPLLILSLIVVTVIAGVIVKVYLSMRTKKCTGEHEPILHDGKTICAKCGNEL